MAERALQLYEAMFLVEPGIATDWDATEGMVRTIMTRAKAELLLCRLWDERRLAYPINKQKRAAYILCYFRAPGSAISGIERDTQLSEHLLRVLVLRADHVTDEQIEKIKAMPDRRLQPASRAAASDQFHRGRRDADRITDEDSSQDDDFTDDQDMEQDDDSDNEEDAS